MLNLLSNIHFNELLGAATLIIAVIFAFLALFPSKAYRDSHTLLTTTTLSTQTPRELPLRISGMSFVVCLSLFAATPYVYFAAVFIIATTITSIDFLENLAAIIRGSPEFWKYKQIAQQTQSPKALKDTPPTPPDITIE